MLSENSFMCSSPYEKSARFFCGADYAEVGLPDVW
jgi:hypothetical protein